MSFRRAALAAFAARCRAYGMLVAITFVVAGLSTSCGNSSHSSKSHSAYVTFPAKDAVALLHVNDDTGTITLGTQTPSVLGTSPTGLALDPGKKFLYVGNSAPGANSITIFSIAGDGTLTQDGAAMDIGDSPRALAIDASGKYLLVTTNFAIDNLLVFSLATSGAPTLLGSYVANTSPNNLLITPTNNYVYVSNSDVGLITAFSLNSASGTLTPISGSPFLAGAGVAGMATDPSSRYLYAANNSDNTVSAYTIDSSVATPGKLTKIQGSPYGLGVATGPRAVATDVTGSFVYVANAGSNNVSAFNITPGTGQLTVINNGTAYSVGTSPVFILADPDGLYLYIGNQGSTNISGFTFGTTAGTLTAITGSPFTVVSAPGNMVITH